MKKRIAAIALFVAFAYLLYPLSSEKYEITFDRVRLSRNVEFLDTLHESHPVDRKAPNVILLLADDLGKTDISLYGGTAVQTPNIDAIGHAGVVFTDAYCTSPICSPSRAALLSGRYPQRYGFEAQPMTRYPKNRIEYAVFKYLIDTGDMVLQEFDAVPRKRDIVKQGLPPTEITIAEMLQSRGYRTGVVGKWHVGYEPPLLPMDRGFDYQYGFYEAFSLYAPVDDPHVVNYRHDYFANKHIWSQERKGYCAIRRNGEVIDETEYLTFAIANEAVRFIEQNRDNPFFLYVPFSAPHTPFQAPSEYYDRFSHVTDENKRVYFAMISALDDAVGRIMDRVRELELEENTVVWFASDNGGATYTGATNNDPLKGGKFNYFEGGVNVPAMLRWPGRIPAGSTLTEPVSLMDVFATTASLTDTPLPQDVEYDGVDLMPHIQHSVSDPPHDALYWKAFHASAVRAGDWKLILEDKTGRVRLYNLVEDKNETRNLASAKPELVQELRDRLAKWKSELPGPLWPRVMDYRFEFDGEEFLWPL